MSVEPIWVLNEVVDVIHNEQLAEHGGREGVLSSSALDAALANPKHFFHYTKPTPDIPAIAAQYAFSLTNNHPFQDGNKRTAAVVCETFLVLNGYELTATEEEAYEIYLSVAEGALSAEQLAERIRNAATKVE